jgi:hypothetical protein
MFLQQYAIYGGETLGAIDWNSIINQGFAIGSQAIGAFGKRPTTQVAAGQGGIFAINAPNATYSNGVPPGYYQLAAQQQTAALLAAQQNRNRLGVDDAIGSILSYIERNPLFVGAIVLGLFLLFKEPPRRR